MLSENQMYTVLQNADDPDVEWLFYFFRKIVRKDKTSNLKIGKDHTSDNFKKIEFEPKDLQSVLELFLES